jgi:hypothetical protein
MTVITRSGKKWSEQSIARAIVMQIFKGSLMLVPNCNWTGYECDLLVVDKSLRIIDIEIKISRADFKCDAKKDKWFAHYDAEIDGSYKDWNDRGRPQRRREWPTKVWKHYFVMPKDIWDDSLLAFLPSQVCGVLLIAEHNGEISISVKKPAKPNTKADKIAPETCVDIGRLAAFRMWESFRRYDQLLEVNEQLRLKVLQ